MNLTWLLILSMITHIAHHYDVVNLDISSVQILTFINKTKFPNSFHISIEMLIMSNYIYNLKFLCSDWEKHRDEKCTIHCSSNNIESSVRHSFFI